MNTVRRFNTVICDLPDDVDAIRQWILDNVPPIRENTDRIPENATAAKAMEIATQRHYTFTSDSTSTTSNS